ncbi:formin-binding protein [Marasmius crinis-equi]|uniref:Formin-binding protein n=1 Tax=Marasmius crinis-equi TaxID=585013 RepID=A0ABR3FI03_9AGAR
MDGSKAIALAPKWNESMFTQVWGNVDYPATATPSPSSQNESILTRTPSPADLPSPSGSQRSHTDHMHHLSPLSTFPTPYNPHPKSTKSESSPTHSQPASETSLFVPFDPVSNPSVPSAIRSMPEDIDKPPLDNVTPDVREGPRQGPQTEDEHKILFHVKALYSYAGELDKDFSFQAGDIIAVTATPNDGWWSGHLVDENKRQPGKHVFPSNFVVPSTYSEATDESPLDNVAHGVREVPGQGPVLFCVKALYDWEATIDEGMSFQAGDIIAVTAASDDGWWSGHLVDETRRQPGRHIFPNNFVRLHDI